MNSVTISPTTASVAPGTQTDFSAMVNVTNSTTSTSTAVTWEVNGIVGGNSAIGAIVSSATDNQLGVYTAPTAVPNTNNGQVDITAVAQQTNPAVSTSSSTTSISATSGTTAHIVTSNTVVVTIGVAQGFSVSPTVSTIPAGGTVQFSATLNGVADEKATWSTASSTGGNPGTIGTTSGLYTAPLSPPPGNSVTITGQDGTNSITETLTIVFSDHSLTGPYAFSYTGENQLGFYSVAGSFVADGNGNIESGVQDTASFQDGVASQVSFSGNYVVGTDGRGTATFNNGNTWRFVLATNQHALIIRSDANTTGSGAVDQQSLNALTTSNSVVSGPYVFAGLGADLSFAPLAIAGKFSADGTGNIPMTNTILDVNDAGVLTHADTSLNGSYALDATLPGTGRGTLVLTSTPTGQRKYAFYAVDSTHLRLVEIDHNAYFAGDAFAAPTGSSFSTASLAAGNYAFTVGGNAGIGAYAAGGVFTSNGAGSFSGGTFDANTAGTVQTNTTLGSCAYSVDAATGRIDLKLCGAGTSEFAVYQTARNSALMLEVDATAISTGAAFQQTVSSAGPSGQFALKLTGQGIFHNAPGSYQGDVEGQAELSGTGVTGGTLDINNFNEVLANDPINVGTITTTTGATPTPASTISAPSSTGRGTAVITGENPGVTYNLVYYLIDANTALLFDQDAGFILTGVLTSQF